MLDELINAEELREQIIERAAEKAIARWQPPKDEDGKRHFDGDLERRVTQMFQAMVERELVEPVSNAIEVALDQPFFPTDTYGSRRPGAAVITMREVIAAKVEKALVLRDGRYASDCSPLTNWLNKAVDEQVATQLKANFQTIATEVSKSAAKAIQETTAHLIKREVRG